MAKKALSFQKIVYKQFIEYYDEFESIAERAPALFIAGELDRRLKDDLLRIHLYRSAIDKSVATAQAVFGEDLYDKKHWQRMRDRFKKKYKNELATTYFTSVMRKILAQQEAPVEYDTDGIKKSVVDPDRIVFHYPLERRIDLRKVILSVFSDSVLSISLFKNISQDTGIIVDILQEKLKLKNDVKYLEVLSTAFFRGKGAYIVGQFKKKRTLIPIVFCVVSSSDGMKVDAVLIGHKATRNFLFSSTRSAFTVSTRYYRELYSFLQRLFPQENPAYIFDLIGFTHPAKISLLHQLRKRIGTGEQCQYVGTGPVDLVFGLRGFPLVIKVLRRGITDRKNVIDNFLKVHETDRLGQALDSLDFSNLTFKRTDFSTDLIKILEAEEPEDVIFTSDHIFFKRVYVSRRIVQIPEYISTASKKEVQQVLINVGWNIKHLAAMGYFPKSLSLEHFGYTNWGRVVYLNNAALVNLKLFLFRYKPDAALGTERYSANPAAFEQELGIPPKHRDMFRAVHGDLFLPSYWEDIKLKVHSGEYPEVFPYESQYRLGPRKFHNALLRELHRLNKTSDAQQIRIVLDNLAVIDVELAGLSFLRLEVPHPSARVLVVEPIGPDIIAQLHLRFQDVTFDILQSESEVVESAGQWTSGIHGKLKSLVQVRRYDYVIGYVNENFDYDFFRLAKLKGFLLLSTGTHNIDVDAATGFHTVVTNAPGPTTTTVAEQNIGVILDAMYSNVVPLEFRSEELADVKPVTEYSNSPLLLAQILWLRLLQRTLRLEEMFDFGESRRYVRTGVGTQATVYHDQIGQNKEAGIIRSIGVIGLNRIGLHIVEFAIAHEVSTVFLDEREYWNISSDEKEGLDELVAIVRSTSETDSVATQIIPVNRSALLEHSTYTFNANSKGADGLAKKRGAERVHIDIQGILSLSSTARLSILTKALTLGIQGLGRIGQSVAQRAVILGINVLIYQRDPNRSKYRVKLDGLQKLATFRSRRNGREIAVEFTEDKPAFFKRTNVITTLAATTKSTRGWVDTEGLECFGTGTTNPIRVVVSAGKGLVDEDALISYLKSNPDAEARLDVLEGEHEGEAYRKLVDDQGLPLTNLKVTGHTAAAVREVRQLKIYKALKNLRNLIDGRIPPDIVNNSITSGKTEAEHSIINIEELSFFRMKVPSSVARVLVIEPLAPEIVLYLQQKFGDVSFDILLAESELVKKNDKWSPGINNRLNAIVRKGSYNYCLGYCNANFDSDFFDEARLEGLMLFASAIHHVDLKGATRAGTIITNAPGYTTVAVTEQNMGMVLDALFGRCILDHHSVDAVALDQLKVKGGRQARTVAQIMWFILLRSALNLNEMFEFGSGDKYVRTGIRQDATVYHDQLGQFEKAGLKKSIGIIGLDEVGLNLVELAIAHELSIIYVLEEEYSRLSKQQKARLGEFRRVISDVSQTKPFAVQIIPVDKDDFVHKATYTIKAPVAFESESLREIRTRSAIDVLADKIFIKDPGLLFRSLIGLTFGVQGLGRIGEAVVQRVLAFGANVVVCQRNPERPKYQQKQERLRRLAQNRSRVYHQNIDFEYVNKDQLFRKSNIVTTLAATTSSTRFWVDRKALDILGAEAQGDVRILVNAGKGLLNEAELIPFLRERQDVEVRLDVLSDEQKGEAGKRFVDNDGQRLTNLKIAGHTAAAVPELRRLKIFHAINNLRLHMDGEKPNNVLNQEVLVNRITE